MSIFDEDDNGIKTSIQFFNQLTDEDKARIVANLNPESSILKKYGKELFQLFSKIQKDLSRFDEIKIGNKLMDLGLEETYSRLIVTNMKKHAPTLTYQLSQIDKINDEDFIKKFEKIMNAIWIDDEDEINVIEKYHITHDQHISIVGIVSHLINGLLRGDMTEKQVIRNVIDKGLSQQKAEILLKSIQTHREIWHPTLLFSNTQDTFFNIKEIIKQNHQLLNSMKEILKLLKTQDSSEKRNFQQ